MPSARAKTAVVAALILALLAPGAAAKQLQKPNQRPRVGISACLLGWMVRYDARPKGQPTLVAALSKHVDLVPFCPEVAAGLTVPRSPIDIHIRNGRYRVIEQATGKDLTRHLRRTNRAILASMERQGIAGCVMKAKSPSCGLRTTKIFKNEEVISTSGSGTLAFELLKRDGFPLVDENQLQRPGGVQRFVKQVEAYARAHASKARRSAVPSQTEDRPHPLAEARQIIGRFPLSRGFARELSQLTGHVQRKLLSGETRMPSVQQTKSAPGVRIIDKRRKGGRTTGTLLLAYPKHPQTWDLLLQKNVSRAGANEAYLARAVKKLDNGRILEVVDRIDDAKGGGVRGAYVLRDPQGQVLKRGRTRRLYQHAWTTSEQVCDLKSCPPAARQAERKIEATFGISSARLVSLMDDLVR